MDGALDTGAENPIAGEIPTAIAGVISRSFRVSSAHTALYCSAMLKIARL